MGILRQNSGDITQGVICKQLLAFFFPLWFGTFFSSSITPWTRSWWAVLWARPLWPLWAPPGW